MATLPPELRRVAPDAFVVTRDALSRRLRQAGEREAAAEVHRLRRPSAPLWALNQLAAVAPDPVTELVRAGEALRATTQQALQGGRGALGRLSGAHARLVDQLTGRAMELLAGLPAPVTSETRSRVWTMLRSASLDAALAPLLAEGSLAEEPVSTGFDGLLSFEVGSGAEAEPSAPGRRTGTRAVTAAPQSARLEQSRALRSAMARVESARIEAARRRERLVGARERAADLRAQADAAEQEAERARHDADAAEGAVEAAEAAAKRLRTNEGE